MLTKTAVLIFAFSQKEAEKRNKLFANKELYASLTNRVRKIVDASKIDHFYFTEKKQIGSSFGERFSNAIAAIYAKGYDNVITIGNDTPNLTVDHLLETKEALESKSSVIGPSYDGGFYLLGLQKEYFDATKFENFSWNTSKITKQIRSYIEQYTTQIVQFEYLHDIDNDGRLKLVFKSLALSQYQLRNIIQKLIQIQVFQFLVVEINAVYTLISKYYNKGSPSRTLLYY